MNSRAIQSVVILAIIAFIVAYLQKMKTCECVDKALVKRLEYTELAIAGVISIGLIANIVTNGKIPLKSFVEKNFALTGALVAIIITLYVYLAFLVYNYSVDATGCKCADHTAKYFLYTQGALYAIMVGMVALLIPIIMMR
jgi:magnesium-transporting ATPase (P-type)